MAIGKNELRSLVMELKLNNKHHDRKKLNRRTGACENTFLLEAILVASIELWTSTLL
jgi:hypothetical protein